MKYFFTLLLITLLVSACAPQTQGATEEATEPGDTELRAAPVTSLDSRLLGNTLNVPGTDASVAVDTPLLGGELAPFEVGNDKGTLRLLSGGMSVTRGEREFLVLPVEILRVSGAGGLYLMLLEQTGETMTQRDAQSLGKRLRLLRLELENTLITATTVDSRLGKAPDFEVSGGGVMRFRLQGGRLEPVS